MNPKERAAAVAHVRSFAVESFVGFRFRPYLDSQVSEKLVPDVPLPSARLG